MSKGVLLYGDPLLEDKDDIVQVEYLLSSFNV